MIRRHKGGRRVKKAGKKETQLVIKGFDPELRLAMKVAAIRAGKPMRVWAAEVLRAAVDKAETAT
jgi:plasmid stability protein